MILSLKFDAIKIESILNSMLEFRIPRTRTRFEIYYEKRAKKIYRLGEHDLQSKLFDWYTPNFSFFSVKYKWWKAEPGFDWILSQKQCRASNGAEYWNLEINTGIGL